MPRSPQTDWPQGIFRIVLAVVFGLAGCAGRATLMPKEVTFNCRAGKSIRAIFYPGNDRRVDLQLSDGRRLSVPRAVSGSGARYANADESFVFWNKGDTAFITEGSPGRETYGGCVLEKPAARN